MSSTASKPRLVKCPACGKENIRRSNQGSAPGFYCWQKTGGCGANFHHDDQAIPPRVRLRVFVLHDGR